MVGSKSKGTLTRETETWCRRLVEDRVVRRGREVRRERGEKRGEEKEEGIKNNNNKDSRRKTR